MNLSLYSGPSRYDLPEIWVFRVSSKQLLSLDGLFNPLLFFSLSFFLSSKSSSHSQSFSFADCPSLGHFIYVCVCDV